MIQSITLKTPDGFSLDADFLEGINGKGIIFAHGITVNRNDEGVFFRASKELNQQGFSTLLFDFRGHGKNSGNPIQDFTISGQLVDIQTAIDFLKHKKIEAIGLAGASFGGGASALYASAQHDTIKALFLDNPALNYEKTFLHPTTEWAKKYYANYQEKLRKDGYVAIGSRGFKAGPKLFDEMEQYSPVNALKSFSNPLLIVHGDKDSKVAYQDVVECFGQLPNENKELQIIQGAEHGFHEEPFETEVTKMIVDFFVKTML